jgi:hygromycin-B 7''-O-kinase
VAGQRARCVSEQRALSAPALSADQIPRFLGGAGSASRPPALLHTEVTRQHLLTAKGPEGAWRLSGLTGSEPTMRREREYELADAGMSAAAGDSRFLTGH